MSERYLCIHAHFYQPPRENPWLEAVELQESAHPYHDWNERITAECYAPNSASRILDADGRIARIVNTYSRISFNFGPTLLSWMESNARKVYAAIVEADHISRERYSGHGSAIAQVYNHMILPLANRRDKQTQVLWGIRDFEHRFSRAPEGMWLAETAVDTETLEVLAEAGIKFTILAPHQAARVRPLNEVPDAEWQEVSGGQIDPTTVYLQRLPSGRSINLFFYDGPISRAVAFEDLLSNGETFAERLLGGFSGERDRAQLVHIATDGETYGHHKAHGDMALAYALHRIESKGLARLTNYGEFLEKFPPTHEVQLAENTSWSCAHGVDRWRSDCGCNSGGHAGWNQAWRGPLREAFDWLRDTTAPLFQRAAGELLRSPAEARDDYIRVLLERVPETISSFLQLHAAHPLDAAGRTRALRLLEMERHAMLMYTSCGWFFDELSGIETVQVLQYAGRVAQLAQQLFGDHVEEELLQRLENVHGNLPESENGREIYEKWVKPAAITLEDVAAHYAIASLFQRHAESAPTYCYSVARLDYHLSQAGRARLCIGQALVTSRITEESLCASFATLHFGDHNLVAGVRSDCERQEYNALVKEAGETFQESDLPGAVRLLDRAFAGPHYSLKSLFRDEQRRIVDSIIRGILGEAESSYRHIYDQHAPLMRFLTDLGFPLPRVLEVSAEHVLNSALRREFADDPDLAHVRTLLEAARQEHVTLHAAELGYVLRKTLDRNFTRLQEAPADVALLSRLTGMVEMARLLPFAVSLWKAQNIYYQLVQSVYPTRREVAGEEARAWTAEFERLGELLSFSTSIVELPAAA